MRGAPIAALTMLVAAGCGPAAAPVVRVEAPYTRAFAAAARAVAPSPIERADPAEGRIVTGYAESLADRTQGYLLEGHFIERRRYELHLWPEGARTAIEVDARVERRAPGGTRALRWERVDAADSVADLVAGIRRELAP